MTATAPGTIPVLRFAAFTDPATGRGQDGGNPAGVVLDASGLDDTAMQALAAQVGYAETAFVTVPVVDGDRRHSRLRFFSPVAEVPFCGHATVATAVALAGRGGVGALTFDTSVGPITIETRNTDAGITASFTSVEPQVRPIVPGVLAALLGLLGVPPAALHPDFPPRLSFAGNWHPVLVFADQGQFDTFTFEPTAMRALMDEQGWAGTVTTLSVRGPAEFEARNLFPVGTMSEDPATGSAAASVGGYLRELGRVAPPARVVIRQGRHVGRPSLLLVDVPVTGGIVVSGSAAQID
ncbi:PhzF family phenazine biosynthesis protein [Cryobacterium sp.]|jgi:PhzF family phenazine biosynthesis protein|uniref:PhzF family phenazine biosynthesis protein n=1 Tax=Cryobacterium sp. TaxID=1926290 RepID=UPI00262A6475|nr:PhzF family phenazine biosynthesis protein [Cryobacterium sp.]MCU1447203.1 phenazine biosynthesis protein PhzF [Cryobacterium sp.]